MDLLNIRLPNFHLDVTRILFGFCKDLIGILEGFSTVPALCRLLKVDGSSTKWAVRVSNILFGATIVPNME